MNMDTTTYTSVPAPYEYLVEGRKIMLSQNVDTTTTGKREGRWCPTTKLTGWLSLRYVPRCR